MDEAILIILTQPVFFFQLQLFKKEDWNGWNCSFCCNQGQVSTCPARPCYGKSCLPPHVINEHVAVVYAQDN